MKAEFARKYTRKIRLFSISKFNEKESKSEKQLGCSKIKICCWSVTMNS